MKDPNEEIVVDFSRFLKKIHEVEAMKNKQPQFNQPDPNALTPQQEYIRAYDERAVNRIYFGKKRA
jgi:hypothetical protein